LLSLLISILGSSAAVIGIITYFATVDNIRNLRREKDSSAISLFFSVLLFIYVLNWEVYGILTNNPYIMAPNIVGCILIPYYIYLILKYR
jgi:uncharacterized protein with PQ loop repeat